MLNREKRQNTGMSDHEYASRFGWTVELRLSPEEYKAACNSFESNYELQAFARKCFQWSIDFRKSFFGKIIAGIVKIPIE